MSAGLAEQGAVLDASALLAFLHDEPGAEKVEAELASAVISSVNWAETVQRLIARGVDVGGLRDDLQEYGLTILSFSVEEAELAGALWARTRDRGLSLGDRACLATAARLGLPAYTADRAWLDLELGVEVRAIR